MSKHTPGPWKIGAPPPNGEQTIGTLGGLMVAVATTGCGMPTLANARLISAAPDLLEALVRLMDIHCPLIGSPSMDDLIDYWTREKSLGRGEAEDMLFALDAIAKAKGEQQ